MSSHQTPQPRPRPRPQPIPIFQPPRPLSSHLPAHPLSRTGLGLNTHTHTHAHTGLNTPPVTAERAKKRQLDMTPASTGREARIVVARERGGVGRGSGNGVERLSDVRGRAVGNVDGPSRGVGMKDGNIPRRNPSSSSTGTSKNKGKGKEPLRRKPTDTEDGDGDGDGDWAIGRTSYTGALAQSQGQGQAPPHPHHLNSSTKTPAQSSSRMPGVKAVPGGTAKGSKSTTNTKTKMQSKPKPRSTPRVMSSQSTDRQRSRSRSRSVSVSVIDEPQREYGHRSRVGRGSEEDMDLDLDVEMVTPLGAGRAGSGSGSGSRSGLAERRKRDLIGHSNLGMNTGLMTPPTDPHHRPQPHRTRPLPHNNQPSASAMKTPHLPNNINSKKNRFAGVGLGMEDDLDMAMFSLSKSHRTARVEVEAEVEEGGGGGGFGFEPDGDEDEDEEVDVDMVPDSQPNNGGDDVNADPFLDAGAGTDFRRPANPIKSVAAGKKRASTSGNQQRQAGIQVEDDGRNCQESVIPLGDNFEAITPVPVAGSSRIRPKPKQRKDVERTFIQPSQNRAGGSVTVAAAAVGGNVRPAPGVVSRPGIQTKVSNYFAPDGGVSSSARRAVSSSSASGSGSGSVVRAKTKTPSQAPKKETTKRRGEMIIVDRDGVRRSEAVEEGDEEFVPDSHSLSGTMLARLEKQAEADNASRGKNGKGKAKEVDGSSEDQAIEVPDESFRPSHRATKSTPSHTTPKSSLPRQSSSSLSPPPANLPFPEEVYDEEYSLAHRDRLQRSAQKRMINRTSALGDDDESYRPPGGGGNLPRRLMGKQVGAGRSRMAEAHVPGEEEGEDNGEQQEEEGDADMTEAEDEGEVAPIPEDLAARARQATDNRRALQHTTSTTSNATTATEKLDGSSSLTSLSSDEAEGPDVLQVPARRKVTERISPKVQDTGNQDVDMAVRDDSHPNRLISKNGRVSAVEPEIQEQMQVAEVDEMEVDNGGPFADDQQEEPFAENLVQEVQVGTSDQEQAESDGNAQAAPASAHETLPQSNPEESIFRLFTSQNHTPRRAAALQAQRLGPSPARPDSMSLNAESSRVPVAQPRSRAFQVGYVSQFPNAARVRAESRSVTVTRAEGRKEKAEEEADEMDIDEPEAAPAASTKTTSSSPYQETVVPAAIRRTHQQLGPTNSREIVVNHRKTMPWNRIDGQNESASAKAKAKVIPRLSGPLTGHPLLVGDDDVEEEDEAPEPELQEQVVAAAEEALLSEPAIARSQATEGSLTQPETEDLPRPLAAKPSTPRTPLQDVTFAVPALSQRTPTKTPGKTPQPFLFRSPRSHRTPTKLSPFRNRSSQPVHRTPTKDDFVDNVETLATWSPAKYESYWQTNPAMMQSMSMRMGAGAGGGGSSFLERLQQSAKKNPAAELQRRESEQSAPQEEGLADVPSSGSRGMAESSGAESGSKRKSSGFGDETIPATFQNSDPSIHLFQSYHPRPPSAKKARLAESAEQVPADGPAAAQVVQRVTDPRDNPFSAPAPAPNNNENTSQPRRSTRNQAPTGFDSVSNAWQGHQPESVPQVAESGTSAKGKGNSKGKKRKASEQDGEGEEQMKLQSFGFFKRVTRGSKGRDRKKEFERDFGEEEDVDFNDEQEDQDGEEEMVERVDGEGPSRSGAGLSERASRDQEQDQRRLVHRPEKERQLQSARMGKLPEPPMHPGFRSVAKRARRDLTLAEESMMVARPAAASEVDQDVEMDQEEEQSVQAQERPRPRSSPHSARVYALPDDNDSLPLNHNNRSKRPGIDPLPNHDEDLVPSSQVDENQSLLSLSAYSLGNGGAVTDGEGSEMGGDTQDWWNGIKRRARH